jgi:two-component system LytT family response regulator
MMRAILIDDEPDARLVLRELLARASSEIDIIGEYEDLESGVEAIKNTRPDVVFLDIQMPNYAGYEIVNFIDKIKFEIIFVTAHDEFALKAFELSAIDYLLKPVKISRLSESIERLNNRIQTKQTVEDYKSLCLSLTEHKIKTITIIQKNERVPINLDQIVVIQAQEAYSVVHTRTGDKYISSKHLKHFERLLESESNFCRTHKSWLINLNCVERYSKSELHISLSGGLVAKLSRYKKEQFESRLMP